MQQQKWFQARIKYSLLTAGFALFTSIPLSAQSAGFVLTGEIAFGGDDLAVVSGGGGDLQAGQFLNLGIGYDFDLNAAKTLRLRTGINYKFDSIDASNGDASFDRWPLDVLVISRQGNFALGAGITCLRPSRQPSMAPPAASTSKTPWDSCCKRGTWWLSALSWAHATR